MQSSTVSTTRPGDAATHVPGPRLQGLPNATRAQRRGPQTVRFFHFLAEIKGINGIKNASESQTQYISLMLTPPPTRECSDWLRSGTIDSIDYVAFHYENCDLAGFWWKSAISTGSMESRMSRKVKINGFRQIMMETNGITGIGNAPGSQNQWAPLITLMCILTNRTLPIFGGNQWNQWNQECPGRSKSIDSTDFWWKSSESMESRMLREVKIN